MNPKSKKQNKHWTKKQNQEEKESENEVPQSINHEQASNNVEKTSPRDHIESPEEESLNAQVNKTERSTKSERSDSGKIIPNELVDHSEDKFILEGGLKSNKEISSNGDINVQISENQSEVDNKNSSRKASQNEKISDNKSSRKNTEEKIEKVEVEVKAVSRKVTEEKIEKPVSRKATEEKIEKPVSRKATEEKLEKPVSRKATEEKIEKPISRKATEEKIEKPISRKATEEKIEKPVIRKVSEEKIEKTSIKVEIETSHDSEKVEVIQYEQSTVIKTEESPIFETIEEKHHQESETKLSEESKIINEVLKEEVQPEEPKEPEVDLIEQEMKKTLLSITAMKDEGNRLFKNGEFQKSEDVYNKGVNEVENYLNNNKNLLEVSNVDSKYKEILEDINKQRKFLFSNMANALQKQKKYMDIISNIDPYFDKSYIRLISCAIENKNLDIANFYADLFKRNFVPAKIDTHKEYFILLENANKKADAEKDEFYKKMQKNKKAAETNGQANTRNTNNTSNTSSSTFKEPLNVSQQSVDSSGLSPNSSSVSKPSKKKWTQWLFGPVLLFTAATGLFFLLKNKHKFS